MFRDYIIDFTNEDFARIVLCIKNYEEGCESLIKLAREKEVPLDLISDFVNVQRGEYCLPLCIHLQYREVLLDSVVVDNKYMFKPQNLRVALSTIVSLYDITDINYICKIMKQTARFLSLETNYRFNMNEYILALSNFLKNSKLGIS